MVSRAEDDGGGGATEGGGFKTRERFVEIEKRKCPCHLPHQHPVRNLTAWTIYAN